MANMGGGFGQRRSFAPIKVGDEFEVKIEGVGEKGDGIAKKDGFVVFVPNVKEGETVKVKVTRVLRKFGFAEKVGQGSSSEDAPAETTSGQNDSNEDQQSESSEDSENFGDEEDKDY